MSFTNLIHITLPRILVSCFNGFQGLEDSLSGSASSSSDDDSENDADPDDAVSALIQKHKKHHIRSKPQGASSDEDGPVIPRSPIVWFQSPSVPNTQFGAYTAIFPVPKSNSTPLPADSQVEAIKDMQDGGEKGRRWALFMTAGGHFAGMIARVSKPGRPTGNGVTAPSSSDGGLGKKPKAKGSQVPDLEIVAHKTFHRYTSMLVLLLPLRENHLILTLTFFYFAKHVGSKVVHNQ